MITMIWAKKSLPTPRTRVLRGRVGWGRCRWRGHRLFLSRCNYLLLCCMFSCLATTL